ncbi:MULTISPECIES: dipeptide ABC transporter ATP-binding protein [unclassified Nocardiopsis]|uniref:dipeptide ABC transporter ATP-binding protein n=1 Tax=Nocardiopsis TaxID=2013 RepID=UPI00387AF46C
MSRPLARIRGLSVDFPGRRATVAAVRDVSLDVHAGRCLAVVGESGSGKSVTARALLGLAGARAEVRADELSFSGVDLRALDERRWRSLRGRRVGYVLQDALTSLDPLRRVGDEVAEPLEVHRLATAAELDERVPALLREAGVPDPAARMFQYPHELSGGLRQRALIASALAADPELVIADEPTTALDVTVQAQILDLLAARRARGGALLLISHDLAVVAGLADEIAVMYAGLVVERGPAGQVLAAPAHPYTAELLAAAPTLEGPVPVGQATAPTAPAAERGCPYAPRCPLADDGCRAELPPPTAWEGDREVRCRHAGVPLPGPAGPVDAAPPVAVPGPGEDTAGDGGAAPVPVLEAVGLTKTYRSPGGGTRTAVRDVSLALAPGEALGVVGGSGSGKSTVARLLMAEFGADAGSVSLAGEPWSGPPERARRPRRHRIQLVDQDPLGSFDPRFAVGRVIAEALERRVPRAERPAEVARLLEAVGLDPALAGRSPARLSGGQRQRVAIARALAPGPDVLVCDEPVSALDVTVQARILALLGRLRRETGTALVFISHDLAVVRRVCDRVAVMQDGRIVETGPAEEVLRSPAHPYTRSLLAAVPRPVPPAAAAPTKGLT